MFYFNNFKPYVTLRQCLTCAKLISNFFKPYECMNYVCLKIIIFGILRLQGKTSAMFEIKSSQSYR